ncbi:hypothetical protein DFH08DRAFT_1033821 [Mycena albidolilacea]|uniref:Novel STAND NTPase 1 domain-containing protein n=1 Tax=Mycena albidolilacea TaxID=1033008 RepID=A0AAD7EHC0_9AGAR|nr:hypothetical protein DFH08DRAFT_1033821 [Mycena albidolilacea]
MTPGDSFDESNVEIHKVNFITDIIKMRHDAEQNHKEVLDMISGFTDMTSSDKASTISWMYSGSYTSSNSISMLPSEPKIFHGRESELSDLLELFVESPPRIAILGAGGMGKTSLARAIVHHAEITAKYTQHRYFIACDVTANRVELAACIGAHLGLKPGKDLTLAVVHYFKSGPPCLLVLDNLETVWEPTAYRRDIEEFLSLLTNVQQLALVITMRGAERPAKPLTQDAAHQTFVDIAEDHHNPEDIDRVLSLTENMPLAINLIAHLVDVEGCSSVLSRWEAEKTAVISEGYDKKSNLEMSISLSLSSPRIKAVRHAQELLSLLSILPDGLSDVELLHSKIPIEDIQNCKTTLIRTAVAYLDDKKQLKALVPIREYMQKTHPPRNELVKPLSKYFHELLELHKDFFGTKMNSATVGQISSNLANIQSLLQNGLQKDHPDLTDNIFSALNLNLFSRLTGRGPETLVAQALEHFEYFDDPDLKSRSATFSKAMDFCCLAITLATSSGNTKRHSQALHILASIHCRLGDYSSSQTHASQAQRLARISADLYNEALALHIEAMAWTQLGNYKQGISLCSRARDLLVHCDHSTMNQQAEIHLMKSEYREAHNIQTRILQQCSVHMDPYAFLNLAEISLSTNAPKLAVQQDIERARKIFLSLEQNVEITMCDTIMADLYLREGDIPVAEALFKQCLVALSHSQINSFCLERLGNGSRWGAIGPMSTWATVYLAHSTKFKEKLGIHKALQFLGDIFLDQRDEDTATSLFTVALEGFKYMDVHHSRAKCMLRLGDISKGHGDLLKAVEFWHAARPLFERSSQKKEIEDIDERLASIGEDVLGQHRVNLACLTKLNELSGIVGGAEDHISDIEDLQEDLVGVVMV